MIDLTELVREALAMYMNVKANVRHDDGSPADAIPMLHVVTTAGEHRVAALMIKNVHPTDVIPESIGMIGGADELDAVVWLSDALGKPMTPEEEAAAGPTPRGEFEAAFAADPAGSGMIECLLARARHRDGTTAGASVAYTHDETGTVVYDTVNIDPGRADRGDIPRMLHIGMALQDVTRHNPTN